MAETTLVKTLRLQYGEIPMQYDIVLVCLSPLPPSIGAVYLLASKEEREVP